MVRVSRVSTTAISRNNSPQGINLFREAVPHRAQPPDSISLIGLIRLIIASAVSYVDLDTVGIPRLAY